MQMEAKSKISDEGDSKKATLTEKQSLYWGRYVETGSVRDVAKEFQVTKETVSGHLRNAADKLGLICITDGLPEEVIQARSLRSTKGKASTKGVMQLLQQQNFRCAISGIELSPESCSLDHKIPVSGGGSDSIENLQWVTSEVNRAKGTMSNERFIEMCFSVTDNIRKNHGSLLAFSHPYGE